MSNIKKRASDKKNCKKYLNFIFLHYLLHLLGFAANINLIFDFTG